MKRFLFIIFQMLFLAALAQEATPKPFFSIDKKWVVHKWYISNLHPERYRTFIVTDSEVSDGHEIFTIGEITSDNETTVAGQGYEENGIVYAEAANGFTPVFNFNANPGDRLQCTLYSGPVDGFAEVLSVSSENIMGIDRKVLTVSINGYGPFLWFEGIGSVDPGCSLVSVPWPSNGCQVELDECYEGDRCVFSRKEYFGTEDVEEHSIATDKDPDTMTDLSGRTIKDPRKGDIYIKGGRKMIKP